MKNSPKAAISRISSAAGLVESGLGQKDDFDHYAALEKEFAIGITTHIAAAIKNNPDNTALARQYVPDPRELNFTAAERDDPIGDETYTPVKGIVHRYPDRVLLKVASACAVYCRYCFRREMIGPGADILNKTEMSEAYAYIKRTPTIREVILTGGDPMILSSRQMAIILQELSAIEHIRFIRIHTRVPAADPARIEPNYIQAMQQACTKPLYIALHINHADELTSDVRQCIQNLHEAGFILLSQSVLLNGVNDCADTLSALYTELLGLRVKPYYLHHPDLAKGTGHFRLTLERGMQIYQSLLGRISGLCQPHYMLDIPGGFGKIPVHAGYIEKTGEGCYSIRDYNGNIHIYYDDVPDTHKDTQAQ